MNNVVIFAGGTGTRMTNASVPKQFLEVHEKPIIIHTLEKFDDCKKIDHIVVVCLEKYIEHLQGLIKKYNLSKVVAIVKGGSTGQESIFNGLKKLVEIYGENPEDVVLIHDGVRPIVNDDVIGKNIASVQQHGNAITVSKSTETIVLALDDNNSIDSVLDRKCCYKAQAPQSFYLKEIYANHLKAQQAGLCEFIDSAMLMNHFGTKLYTVEGPVENIKITTPMDYYLFKAILDKKEDEQLKSL